MREAEGQSGPWDPVADASLDYGTHDGFAPSSVNVSAGETLTLSCVSGFVSEFEGWAPSYIDANGYSVAAGYPANYYGSGPGRIGVGSSGDFLPSHFIDPDNVGPGYINLLELIGEFFTATGAVIGTPFAVGDGPLTITVPDGATQLQLGSTTTSSATTPAGWSWMWPGSFLRRLSPQTGC